MSQQLDKMSLVQLKGLLVKEVKGFAELIGVMPSQLRARVEMTAKY